MVRGRVMEMVRRQLKEIEWKRAMEMDKQFCSFEYFIPPTILPSITSFDFSRHLVVHLFSLHLFWGAAASDERHHIGLPL